jgi:hypothetical protein
LSLIKENCSGCLFYQEFTKDTVGFTGTNIKSLVWKLIVVLFNINGFFSWSGFHLFPIPSLIFFSWPVAGIKVLLKQIDFKHLVS